MGIRDYIISASLVGLFVLAIFSFANLSASDNAGRNILSDPLLNGTNESMYRVLNSFSSSSESQLNATTTESPTANFGSLVLFSIVGASRVFTGTIIGVYNVIFVLGGQALGIPPVVLSVLAGITLVSVIFFAYRMYRLGT